MCLRCGVCHEPQRDKYMSLASLAGRKCGVSAHQFPQVTGQLVGVEARCGRAVGAPLRALRGAGKRIGGAKRGTVARSAWAHPPTPAARECAQRTHRPSAERPAGHAARCGTTRSGGPHRPTARAYRASTPTNCCAPSPSALEPPCASTSFWAGGLIGYRRDTSQRGNALILRSPMGRPGSLWIVVVLVGSALDAVTDG